MTLLYFEKACILSYLKKTRNINNNVSLNNIIVKNIAEAKRECCSLNPREDRSIENTTQNEIKKTY